MGLKIHTEYILVVHVQYFPVYSSISGIVQNILTS